jgi:hypothetical protein
MSGEIVDTSIFTDSEVTSLSILVVDTLVFEYRDGAQRNVLDALNDAISSSTVVTFDLNNYTITYGELPVLDTSEDLLIDTMLVNGSTDSNVDHAITVAGVSLYSEDASGLFNMYTTDVSGFTDSLEGLRGVVNASTEIYIGNGAGGYIKLGLAVNALFGLLPFTSYDQTGTTQRRSLHRFGFGMGDLEVEIPISIDVENYLSDFIIENIDSSADAIVFNQDQFQISIGVDASGKFVKSLGAFTVQFVSNTDTNFKITAVSSRAKEYADSWLEEDTHNFHSLYKGLFGQMLLNSGIVPVELTSDKAGIVGESFLGYITDDSLERNVVPKFTDWVKTDAPGGSFFEQEHHQIMTNLQTGFRNIWGVDQNAEWYSSGKSGPLFTDGDVFSVPLEVIMRYKISTDVSEPDFGSGMNGTTNLDPVAISINNIVTTTDFEASENWRFVYKFNVVGALGESAVEGIVSSGPKVGYSVYFYSMKTGSLLHTNSTKTNADGQFVTDTDFVPDQGIYRVMSVNADGSGYDGITLENIPGDELSAIFDAENTVNRQQMCTVLTSLVAESLQLGSTKEDFYLEKTTLESKLSSSPGFDINVNPYAYDSDPTLAAELAQKVLEIEAIRDSMKNILQGGASGLSEIELKRKIQKGMAQYFYEINIGVVADLTNETTLDGFIDRTTKAVLGQGTDTSAYLSANRTQLSTITKSIQTSAAGAGTLEDKLLAMHIKSKQIKLKIEAVGVSSVTESGIDAVAYGAIAVVVLEEAPYEVVLPSISSHLIARWNGAVDGYRVKDQHGIRDLEKFNHIGTPSYSSRHSTDYRTNSGFPDILAGTYKNAMVFDNSWYIVGLYSDENGDFDGTELVKPYNFFQPAAGPTYTSNYTWSVWIKPYSWGVEQTLFSFIAGTKTGAYLRGKTVFVKLRTNIPEWLSFNALNLNLNQWTLLTIMQSNNYIRVFEGKTLIKEETHTRGFYSTFNDQIEIGGQESAQRTRDVTFHGEMSNILSFNEIVDIEEVCKMHSYYLEKNLDNYNNSVVDFYTLAPPMNDLVLRYNMSLTSVSLNDFMGLNEGTIDTGSPVVNSSIYGDAVDISTNYYTSTIAFGNPYNGWDTRGYSLLRATYSFYYKPNALPSGKATLFGHGHTTGFYFGLNENKEYFLDVTSANPFEYLILNGTSSCQVGEWTLVTLIIKDKEIRVYESDVCVATICNKMRWTNFWNFPVVLGDSKGTQKFNGEIASFNILNHREESPPKINQITQLQNYLTSQNTPTISDSFIEANFVFPLSFANTLDGNSTLPAGWTTNTGNFLLPSIYFQDHLPASETTPSEWFNVLNVYAQAILEGAVVWTDPGTKTVTVVWGANLKTSGSAQLYLDGTLVDEIDQAYALVHDPTWVLNANIVTIKTSVFTASSSQVITIQESTGSFTERIPIAIKSIDIA